MQALLLESRQDVDLVALARDEGADLLTLDDAAALLRDRSPGVREAVAAYQAALALAQSPTPWPDPTVEIGPEIGLGPGIDSDEVVPSIGVGVGIPTGGRRGRQDDLNRARAEEARIHALALFRELYIELRARYFAVSIARTRAGVQARIVEGAERSVEATGLLVDAGGAQALDVSLLVLELARERARLLEIEAEVTEAEHLLASLLALDGDRISPLSTEPHPGRPSPVPELVDLRARLHQDNPELARLAAAYEVAERELALEIARQFPDLHLGIEAAGEAGEPSTILNVLLGFAVPMFDRNRQAIVAAVARRTEARALYEAAMDEALSQLTRAHAATVRTSAHRDALIRAVLPAARENLSIARTSLAAGSTGGLEVLDAERSLREVELEALAADLRELSAWIDLERVIGAPLLGPGTPPEAPEALTNRRTETDEEQQR